MFTWLQPAKGEVRRARVITSLFFAGFFVRFDLRQLRFYAINLVMQAWIAWTTTETKADAETLARAAVEAGLAACAQVDGPVRSFFPWKGKIEDGEEFRITFKFSDENCKSLEKFVLSNHTYENPEWVGVPLKMVAENYLHWIQNPT